MRSIEYDRGGKGGHPEGDHLSLGPCKGRHQDVGVKNDAHGVAVRATDFRGGGGYLPTDPRSGVGFVAWGAGIRDGVRLPEMLQVDVGPTAAALLGVSLSGADGKPQIGIIGRTPANRSGPQ